MKQKLAFEYEVIEYYDLNLSNNNSKKLRLLRNDSPKKTTMIFLVK